MAATPLENKLRAERQKAVKASGTNKKQLKEDLLLIRLINKKSVRGLKTSSERLALRSKDGQSFTTLKN